MKKYSFIPLIALLLTAAFAHGSTRTDPLGAETISTNVNTIYLNLTKIGRLDGQAGVNMPAVYLEYGYELTLNVGAPLPSSSVTATTGANFVGWVIQNPTGGLQKITTMPSRQGIILQAHFERGEGTTSEPVTSEPSSETSTSDPISGSEPLQGPGLFIQAVGTSSFLSTYELVENGLYGATLQMEYRVLGLEVTAGFAFYFVTNSDITGTGATQLPSYQSTSKTGEIGYTFSQGATYNTLDYLQTSGQNEGGNGENWFKFISPNSLGSLEFKVSGTYDLYVVFWDNFGWAQIYVQPSI